MGLIALYLAAIVAANLSVTAFGPVVSVLNAFVFIGLDLTTRDALHDRWGGDWRRMAALIMAGSALSAVLNINALPIAVASCVAFGAAGIVDWLVYRRLLAAPRWARVNGSNLFSAAVDSIVFPALAFGFPLLWPVVIGQFVAKVAGGALWSIILFRPLFSLART